MTKKIKNRNEKIKMKETQTKNITEKNVKDKKRKRGPLGDGVRGASLTGGKYDSASLPMRLTRQILFYV